MNFLRLDSLAMKPKKGEGGAISNPPGAAPLTSPAPCLPAARGSIPGGLQRRCLTVTAVELP